MADSSNTSKDGHKALALTAIVLLTVATVLGIFSAGDNVHAWDRSFAQWIQQWEGGLGELLYDVGDMLGTTSLAAAVTGIALVIALLLKRLQISAFLVTVLLLRLVGTQLKPLFNSPRPSIDDVRLLEPFDGLGYPSGHSMTAAMVAAMLVVITWRYVSDERLRRVSFVLATIVVVLVGWSRVWSGAHWPSDVLGGWTFGIALVLLAWICADVITARLPLRQHTAVETSRG